MYRDPLSAYVVVARRPERVRADQYTPLRPPERHLIPPSPATHGQKLERSFGNRLVRDNIELHAKAPSELGAVAFVTIEQLDDAGGRPG